MNSDAAKMTLDAFQMQIRCTLDELRYNLDGCRCNFDATQMKLRCNLEETYMHLDYTQMQQK